MAGALRLASLLKAKAGCKSKKSPVVVQRLECLNVTQVMHVRLVPQGPARQGFRAICGISAYFLTMVKERF
jgi:hypothetical protein